MEKSKLLQHLFDCAEKIKTEKGNSVLTINHVFAAAIQFCAYASDKSLGYDPEEEERVRNIISEKGLTKDVKSYIEILCSSDGSFLDEFYLDKILGISEMETEEKGGKCILADVFLTCLLKAPSDEIEKLNENETKVPSPDDIYSSLKKAVEDIQKRYNPNSKKEEAPDEKEPEQNSEEESESATGLSSKDQLSELTKITKKMQERLSEVVLGQDNAINILVSGYFQAELRNLTEKKNNKPRACFLFAGPPGVGKTMLAEETAQCLSKFTFNRYDMSDYTEKESVNELCGTSEVYRGSKEGNLTGFVRRNPRCVLLFDEIEKAHIEVIHLFLQLLDAGRLRDTFTKEEVDFSQTIVIFTTNAGRKIYENSLTANLADVSRKTILKALESDVDPKSGKSAFPAAICSRFATGNVIMFNHMEPHILMHIIEKTFMKNIGVFESETGIKCSVDEDVYSCLLLAEGGNADARNVTSRAKSFFSTELYELFRLVSNEDNGYNVEDIENIRFSIEYPEDKKVANLFMNDSKGCALTFAQEGTKEVFDEVLSEKGYSNITVSDFDEAKSIISEKDIEVVFCDLYTGRESDNNKELNIEDIRSQGREFFRYVSEQIDVPLYVLSSDEHKYSKEEEFSLRKEGSHGIIDISKTETLSSVVGKIFTRIYQQKNIDELAKSNKIIKYGTAQTISDDGKSAEIRIYDISLETAVDAEDTEKIVDAMSKPNVKFSDIIGAEGAKKELEFFVEYLKNPKKFASKGLGVPKGVLFYGPPGTGKTMLAKAVAGESGVTFIAAEGNQFRKKYIGEGEEEVHKLFATARKYAPAIIFIDEVDSIALERTGENSDISSILTAFLAEMDGFKNNAKKPVFVMAATNFDVEPGSAKSLDGAFLRRFDRRICIDLPDKEARLKFINMKIDSNPIYKISNQEKENIAVRSTGMSLAKLASVFDFSMRIAIRLGKDAIDDSILEEAFETYNFGEEKKWDASGLERTAYHEAGHAFLCWYSGETPSYMTIVARGDHGGYMLHGDEKKTGSYTKNMLLDRIRTSLGGRAAELVFFGEENGLTTGASGDLRTATALAKSIVCNYGMDERVGLAVIQEQELADGVLAQQIRDSVNTILKQELDKAKEILSQNSEAMKKMVELLLVRNHLGAQEIDEVFSTWASQR